MNSPTSQWNALAAQPKRILLTGATGNLGGRLCDDLLVNTVHQIYCLVRGADPVTARMRLERGLERPSSAAGRVIVVPGDLQHPTLGLPRPDYDALAESIDTIVHCAATVNLAAGYGQLAPCNVEGTRHLIALAERHRALTGRPLRFHYISTVGTFIEAHAAGGRMEVDENTHPTAATAGSLGYPRSKAEAESELRASGLPLTVHRPGLVMADSRTTSVTDTDLLVPLIRAAVAIGAAPTDCEAPAETVDTTARAIIALIDHPGSVGRTYHLVREQPLRLDTVFAALRRAGHRLTPLSSPQWWQRIQQSAEHPEVIPIIAMSAVFRRILAADGDYRQPRISSAHTWQTLHQLNVVPSPMDDRYLDRLVANACPSSGRSEATNTADHRRPRSSASQPHLPIDHILCQDGYQHCVNGMAAAATACEAAGFDGGWVYEHRHDPLLTLGAAAASTNRLRLGTNILIALANNPMVLARAANDLQFASAGRFTLGLGTQIPTHLNRRYSVPGDRRHARIREFVLALRAIWECWNTNGRLNFRGEFYSHTLMTPFFMPGPNPYGAPKIFLAAVGPAMAGIAGEVADGYTAHTVLSADYIAEVLVPAAERGLERSGRSRDTFTVMCNPYVITGRTEAERAVVERSVRQELAFYSATPAYRQSLEFHGFGATVDRLTELSVSADSDAWTRMTDLIGDDILDALTIRTEPDDVGREIHRRYGSFADRIVLPAPQGTPEDLWRPKLLGLDSTPIVNPSAVPATTPGGPRRPAMDKDRRDPQR